MVPVALDVLLAALTDTPIRVDDVHCGYHLPDLVARFGLYTLPNDDDPTTFKVALPPIVQGDLQRALPCLFTEALPALLAPNLSSIFSFEFGRYLERVFSLALLAHGGLRATLGHVFPPLSHVADLSSASLLDLIERPAPGFSRDATAVAPPFVDLVKSPAKVIWSKPLLPCSRSWKNVLEKHRRLERSTVLLPASLSFSPDVILFMPLDEVIVGLTITHDDPDAVQEVDLAAAIRKFNVMAETADDMGLRHVFAFASLRGLPSWLGQLSGRPMTPEERRQLGLHASATGVVLADADLDALLFSADVRRKAIAFAHKFIR